MVWLEKLQFGWDAPGMVRGLLTEWDPEGCETEKDYEKSLYQFLHSKLEDIQVTRQYSRGRIRADLAVGDKVLVELKRNLQKTAQYHRLVGQLSDYKQWGGKIFIVLCGETDPNLGKELRKFIQSEFRSGLDDDLPEIVEK